MTSEVLGSVLESLDSLPSKFNISLTYANTLNNYSSADVDEALSQVERKRYESTVYHNEHYPEK